MNVSDDDLLRLRHMQDYAREVMLFTGDATRADLDTDLKLLRALTLSIGIIGEAASRISEEFRTAHPEIEWQKIIGMRNFLFHAYFNVSPQILWDTAVQSVPVLIPLLEAILQDSG